MGVWQEVAMDSLKFHPGLLRPAGGPFQEWSAHRVGGLQQSSIHSDTPCYTPMSGGRSVELNHSDTKFVDFGINSN
jgi:hypothetical protein